MDKIWTVEQNTGKRADLSSGSERREIRRPHAMSTPEFYSLLAPGTAVDDSVLQELFKK